MRSLVLFLLLVVSSFGQIGSVRKGDDRVRKLLDKEGLKYTCDDDGDFKLHYEIDKNRSQYVFISSETSKYGNMEIREVWSVGYITKEEFFMAPNVMRELLLDSSKRKLGAWELLRSGGKEVGIFSAKISADVDLTTLLYTIRGVVNTADEVEDKLTSRDNF